jgi:hypothetical protein
MCLQKEHVPCKAEIAKYTSGYKVVIRDGSNYKPAYRYTVITYSLRERAKGKWFQATGFDYAPNDAGFYVFINKDEAEAYAQLCVGAVAVKKVYIQDIIAVGRCKVAENQKHDALCVRCKQIQFA